MTNSKKELEKELMEQLKYNLELSKEYNSLQVEHTQLLCDLKKFVSNRNTRQYREGEISYV